MKTIILGLLPSAVMACFALPSDAYAEDQVLKDGERIKTASNAREESDRRKSGNILEEVVVTSQRREERLIEVPMSITALTGEQLSEQGIKNVRDLSYSVPSLSVLESGPGRQIITVRGMAGQRGTSSLTGIYLDEVPLSGVQDDFVASYADIRAVDLARVEVLKGPQGTLFGEGAAGGVVRFITNDPDLNRTGGDIATEFYNTDDGGWSEEITGVINLPIVNDVFGVRVAAKYENIDGWIDQPSIGRKNINDGEVKHLRVKMLYKPNEAFLVKGLAEIHRSAGGASSIVNQTPLRDSNFIQSVLPDARTDYEDDYDLFNVTGSYQFGFAELLSSTSYTKLDSVQSFTQRTNEQPIPYLEIVATGGYRESENKSQEFRLTSSTAGPFKWTIGGLYKDSDLTFWYGREGVHFALFYGAVTVIGQGNGPRSTLTSESWAGFGDASYTFGGRFEVGGGVRHFRDERGSFGSNPPVPEISSEFEKNTYRGYLKYNFSNDANIYFTVGNGFRSGGLNGSFAVTRGAPPTILPETSLFYELGTKLSVLDGRLRLDGAIFYGEYQDMMAARSQPSTIDQIPVQYTANGQAAELKGAELHVDWAASDRLMLSLAGDVIDTEITKIDPADPAPSYALGDPISLVPEYTVSVAANYAFNWTDSVPGSFRVAFNQKGKTYNTERSNVFSLEQQVVSAEVRFLDASLEAEWNEWRWSLFGRNLLDEDAWLYPTTTGWSAQARPRTFGVGVSRSF